MRYIVSIILGLLLTAAGHSSALAASAFTYQGELVYNAVPADGSYDFRFILYSADVGGSQVGPIVEVPAVAVAQGIFTTQIDFGPVFGSADYWLDIAVKPNGGSTYTPLSPRQAVTPAPRALGLSLPYLDVVSLPNFAINVSNDGGGVAIFQGGGTDYNAVLSLFASGAGPGLYVSSGASGQSSAIAAYTQNAERYAAEFEVTNPDNDNAALYLRTNGDGYALQAEVNSDTTASAIFARTTSDMVGSYAGTFGGPVVMSCQNPNCNDTFALRTYGNLNVIGTLSKSAGSFRIDHPLDPTGKYLSHSFVESPDMKNIYDGVVALDANGSARIELPDWFEALNESFRYQLTALGAPSPGLYVSEEVRDNRFAIAGGTPDARVSWQVTGIRHDAYARRYPIPVEEEKTGDDRGRYLVPDAYGLPADQAIGLPPMPAIEAEATPPPASR